MFSDKFQASVLKNPIHVFPTAENQFDTWQQANNEAQADFVKSVVLWATKNAGVLRQSNMKHNRVGEAETPPYYTIEEDIR